MGLRAPRGIRTRLLVAVAGVVFVALALMTLAFNVLLEQTLEADADDLARGRAAAALAAVDVVDGQIRAGETLNAEAIDSRRGSSTRRRARRGPPAGDEPTRAATALAGGAGAHRRRPGRQTPTRAAGHRRRPSGRDHRGQRLPGGLRALGAAAGDRVDRPGVRAVRLHRRRRSLRAPPRPPAGRADDAPRGGLERARPRATVRGRGAVRRAHRAGGRARHDARPHRGEPPPRAALLGRALARAPHAARAHRGRGRARPRARAHAGRVPRRAGGDPARSADTIQDGRFAGRRRALRRRGRARSRGRSRRRRGRRGGRGRPGRASGVRARLPGRSAAWSSASVRISRSGSCNRSSRTPAATGRAPSTSAWRRARRRVSSRGSSTTAPASAEATRSGSSSPACGGSRSARAAAAGRGSGFPSRGGSPGRPGVTSMPPPGRVGGFTIRLPSA